MADGPTSSRTIAEPLEMELDQEAALLEQ